MDERAPLLEVVRLGHPALRSVADEVPEDLFGSGRLAELSQSLARTMIEEQGVGLAAPQVAEGLRLFAFWVPETDDSPEIPPTVLVNPEVRAIGDDIEEGWEGCLSIPELRGLVPRARRVKVKARSIEGAPISLTADGLAWFSSTA
jgi:peptide deformylase